MLGLGALLWFASFWLWALLAEIGIVSGHLPRALPVVALGSGIVLGALASSSPTVGTTLKASGAVLLCGAVTWFLGILVGGVLVGFGVASESADWAPRIGFFVGIGLGTLSAAALVFSPLLTPGAGPDEPVTSR